MNSVITALRRRRYTMYMLAAMQFACEGFSNAANRAFEQADNYR